MKEGLIREDGELRYYHHDKLYHAGVVQVDGDIYYIGSDGRAVTGKHEIHRTMTNGLLERGTYTFGKDGKLIAGSYVPSKHKKHSGKRRKAELLPLLGLIVLAVALVIGVLAVQSWNKKDTPAVKTEITISSFEEEALLCIAEAKQEYDGQLSLEEAVKSGNPYRSFRFEYQLTRGDAQLLISEHENMENASEYSLSWQHSQIPIDNLKTGTTYYYKVTAEDQVHTGSFRTAQSTRFVSIPGTVNTRDIGGRKTEDGKTVKQGLIIRGVELDGLENPEYLLPADQAETVVSTFGFVYDMDLRSPSVADGTFQSALGASVTHRFYDAPAYDQVFTAEGKATLRLVFEDLAKPENYPMYLHCTWGTDRTGIVVFLLQGVLNMSEEDMLREYMLTSYRLSELLDDENIGRVITGLDAYEGDTLQERIVSFLLETGVTEAQLQSIREIHLG